MYKHNIFLLIFAIILFYFIKIQSNVKLYKNNSIIASNKEKKIVLLHQMVILPHNHKIIYHMVKFVKEEERGRVLLNSLLEQLGFTNIEETDIFDRVDCYA